MSWTGKVLQRRVVRWNFGPLKLENKKKDRKDWNVLLFDISVQTDRTSAIMPPSVTCYV